MLRSIEDSRGREHQVFPVAAAWVTEPSGPPPMAVGAWGGWGPRAAVIVSLVLILSTPLMPGPARIVAWVAGAACAAGGVVMFVISPRRIAAAYPAFSALLAEGFCPACSYRIDTVRPEADGCTVCPECGAAWRR